MHNVLSASAVLPTHSEQADLLDLRGRLHACPVDERPIWLCLQDQLEQANRRHCSELHFDHEPGCVRFRQRSPLGVSENQLLPHDPLSKALLLLDRQIFARDPIALSHRAWFVILVAGKELLYQADQVKTSAGTGITLRPLYDAQSPLPQLEQLIALPRQAMNIRLSVQRLHGLILLADSDRTQRIRTARAIAQCLTGPDRRILLSETSCHPLIPGVTQIAVPLHADNAQRQAWRQACDMSHDVLIALETDHDAASLAQHAYQKALVVQGVCADSPSQALTQLVASGTRPESIARSLKYIVTQHQIALACEHCKCPATPDDSLTAWITQQSPVREDAISEWLADRLTDNFVQAIGCEACNETGIGSVTTFADSIRLTEDAHDALFDADVRFASDSLDKQDRFSDAIVALARSGTITIAHAVTHLEKQKARTVC